MAVEIIKTPSGKLISYDSERDLLLVENPSGGSCIVMDLAKDKIYVQAEGDIEFRSEKKIKLSAREGIDLETEGEVKLLAEDEMVIRGKMVRIN